ncbi:M23 family metallopeptidase [Rothia sp. P5764]|uniref:M23 family metallopeptidase n=1 Tax=Rothia sp. P5764 TaxID=3402654 RepID=UPI003AC5D9AC
MILCAPRGKPEFRTIYLRSGWQWLAYCLCALLGVIVSSPCAEAGNTVWQAPLAGQVTVVKAFEKPAAKWSAGHRGVDLALEADGKVLAPAAGTVVFSGTVVDRQVITLEHPDGRRSSFEPITDPLPVGATVAAGDPIARLDPLIQHCPEGHCLHWGVREPTSTQSTAAHGMGYINPLLLLGLEEPSILLPIGSDFAA